MTGLRPGSSPSDSKPLLRVLDGEVVSPRPVWMMRQAGRYLPEYREIRATASSFIDFCYTPRLAVEATLQPIRRFGFDAAILFSDILVIPDALGCPVSFETGHGPRLSPIDTRETFAALSETPDMNRLAPVFETIERVKASLDTSTALLGFCGAPFTVASYMVAGEGTPDQAPARRLAYRDRDLFGRLVDRITAASVDYLSAQIEAGVDAVQIFDSWAGVLPRGEYDRWSQEPIRRLIAGVRARHPQARIITFPRVSGAQLADAARTGADAIGIDTVVDPRWAHETLPPDLPVQGNLDPLLLLEGGTALDDAVDDILAAFSQRPHIFNLGHGILPETPIANVERMLSRVRRG